MAKKKSRRSGRTVRHAASKKPAKKPVKTTRLSRGSKGSPHSTRASAGSKAMGERAIGLLRFAHRMLTDMLAGIPDSRATEQPAGMPNHKLWILGHMAVSHDWTARMIDGKPAATPAEWESLFGMGSKPSADNSLYPSADDARDAYDRACERIIAAVKARADAELATPTVEDTGGYAADKLDVAFKAAWHEGWHLGQAAGLRRALGIAPMMK